MTASTLLALMLVLLPSAPQDRISPIAEAITQVASTREEAVLLAVISYYENGLGRAGVPFGACSYLCAHRCGRCRTDRSLADIARWSLGLLRHAERTCGPSLAVRLGWYHTGRCRADAFSNREAVSVADLLARRRDAR